MKQQNKAILAALLALTLLCGCTSNEADSSAPSQTSMASSRASAPADLVTQLPVTVTLGAESREITPKTVHISAPEWDKTFLFANPTLTLRSADFSALTLSCPKDSNGELVALNAKGEQVMVPINSTQTTLQLPKVTGKYTLRVTLETLAVYTYRQEFEYIVEFYTVPVFSTKAVSAASAITNGTTIELSSDTISPGDTVAVKIKGYNGGKPLYARFSNVDNRVFPLLPAQTGGEQIGFVAISSMTTKPGKLQVYASENGKSGGELIQTASLNVGKKTFNRQDLTVEPGSEMASTGSNENLASDKAIIAEVTAKTAETLYCEEPFIQPAAGRISTQFGQMRYTNGSFTSSHSGLDISAPAGTLVQAANNARVVYAGTMKFYGNTVILDHGMGLFTFYNHMNSISVETDQMVQKGEKIGEVGSTGYSTGPHLHWNIQLYGVNVDPALFTRENSIISDMKRMMSE